MRPSSDILQLPHIKKIKSNYNDTYDLKYL